jgi:hypothetical protein
MTYHLMHWGCRMDRIRANFVATTIMYHLPKDFSIVLTSVVGALLASSTVGFAQPSPLPDSKSLIVSAASNSQLSGSLQLNNQHDHFAPLPTGHAVKKKPLNTEIYQWDDKPLGDRSPFLFVHGLRGEYYKQFRWAKVVNKFVSNPQFNRRYKVYTVRWDTTARMEKVVPQFRQAVSHLYESTGQKPITILALSIGGNLVYESVLDKNIDRDVRQILTLGTPFHGSPLFNDQWLQYSVYKNMAMPLTRVDHSIDFKVYFHRNPCLQKDFFWDDADHAIPERGRFFSYVPFGPSGYLHVEEQTNVRLRAINEQNFDKKKLITYSCYLISPYMNTSGKRFVETTLMFPWVLFSMKIPAHFGREHPVLKFLNRSIGSIVSEQEAVKKAQTPYLYQLNDGIAPLISALFIPDKILANESLCKESDIPRLQQATDVKLARTFRNADHLTFIDGYRPFLAPKKLRDELHPDEPGKEVFDWMLDDILEVKDSH